ncbi:MAG: FeoA family protein [Angelakisella sp.]
MNTTLSLLDDGQEAIVTGLCHNSAMNRRFRDIGLIEGTQVRCLQKSPWGTPAAYLIRGAVIALRRLDCDKIFVDLSI